MRFFRTLIDEPRAVGALLPTGPAMATKMASVVRPENPASVLELGPGTGVITKAVLARGLAPAKLVCIEFSPEFAGMMRARYAGVKVIEGDAFDLDAALGERRGETFDCVVSGLPLLNFPAASRIRLIADLLDRIPAGRPVIQFSYGPKPPVPAQPGRFTVARHAVVLRNVPPAQIWIYRKPAGIA
ncbi:MAG: methyltransferase domain-containing protein [Phyllobacteriaceae bacterium]|nr:methyltransferase domain-containing protein [Phyllobacteriaceae bacterium]